MRRRVPGTAADSGRARQRHRDRPALAAPRRLDAALAQRGRRPLGGDLSGAEATAGAPPLAVGARIPARCKTPCAWRESRCPPARLLLHVCFRATRPSAPSAGRATPCPGPARGPSGALCAAAAGRPQRHRVSQRLHALPGRRHRPRRRDVQRPPRRVSLHRRLHRVGQVDDHAAAHQGARADLRHDPRRRPRPRLARARQGAVLPAQHRRRLPGLQAAAQPHRVRQRRLRAVGDRGAAQGDPHEGARRPAPDGPVDEAAQLPRPALRRRAAARRRRPRVRQPPAAAARRRADRQPGPEHVAGDHAAAVPHLPRGDDRDRRHARLAHGRPHAPARHRAARRPDHPRRGQRHVRPGRPVDRRVQRHARPRLRPARPRPADRRLHGAAPRRRRPTRTTRPRSSTCGRPAAARPSPTRPSGGDGWRNYP